MKYLLLLVAISWLHTSGIAQEYRDYVWQLGSETLGDTVPFSMEFDFNNGKFKMNRIFRDWAMYLTNSSICSAGGELFMSTNGCAIYNKENVILPNGDSLNPGIVYVSQCSGNFGYAVTDGAQFINFSDSVYILFHLGDQILSNPLRVFCDHLYFTAVYNINNQPVIVNKSHILITDSLSRGIECVKKLNGWWCIVQGKYDNKYYIVDARSSDDVDYKIQRIGVTPESGGGGQTVFSPDGTRYARFTPADQLFLFDFDRVQGDLSTFRHIHVSDSGFIGGIAFSPSSQYLYVSSQYDLYQVDTWAEDVQASVVHIDHYDGFFSPFPTTFRLMQLGPDCRIYMIPPNGVDVMHVIHDPDLPGAACNFEQHGIQLPVYNSITLPSFPNYRLDIGPPCDPTITGIADALPRPDLVRIGPIPASDYLNVWWDLGEAEMMLFDIQGRRMLSRRLPASMQLHRLDLDLPAGVYVYVIVSRSGERRSGKVVVHRG